MLNEKTEILFTEIKNGHATGKTYEMCAGKYISMVKEKDSDGNLNIGVEPIFDEEGEIVEYTEDQFYNLPIDEQLDLCCRREGESYAMSVNWCVA